MPWSSTEEKVVAGIGGGGEEGKNVVQRYVRAPIMGLTRAHLDVIGVVGKLKIGHVG